MKEKCNVAVAVVMVRGEDKHKVLMKNRYVTIMLLCL